MGEFSWQLRRPGVISLFQRTGDSFWDLWKALDEGEFEHRYFLDQVPGDTLINLTLLSQRIHVLSNPEDEEEFDLDKLTVPDSFETCRKFLTEHDWLIYVEDTLHFPMQWELIKHHILCESTRARVVVATCNPSVAKHCVDYQHRALSTEDLLNKGCDQQDKSGYAKKKQVKEKGWLVGRDAEVDLLYAFYPGVMSVWGIAGIGKSAIVREIYDRSKLHTQVQMLGWVDVPHPFSLTDMCRRLFLEFYSDDADAMERTAIGMIEDQDLIRGCCKILRERICLLVIDGLRSTHDWDLIRSTLLSQANIYGQTIVITHEESIANHCTNREEGRTLNVKGLDANMALGLFKKITLDNKELSAHPLEAKMISRLISSKCGGLPKVIVAMGRHVSTFGCQRLGSIDGDFMGCLQNNSDFPSLTSLFCWMQSYFHTCPDELKPCIFYVSIFPAEQSIRPSRLLRRLIAEGYSSGGGGTEEKGESLLSELMKLSILYQDMKGSSTIRSYRVSGFFHEYIKSQPMEDNLVFALEGSCSPSSRLTGQHLTISSSWDRDEIVFNSMDLSRLRSLTVFGKWVSFLVSDKMKVLRVLDLEGTSSTPDGIASVTDDVLEKIVKQFPRLKFMSLRGCMEVTRLPDSLGAMSQLETLDARHTSIVELPPAVITKLHKLQYIRAGTTEARRLQQAAAVAAAAQAATAEVAAAEAAVTAPTPPSSPPPTTTQEDVVHSGTSPFLVGAKAAALRVVQQGSTRVTGAWKRRAHALVESNSRSSWWESKKQRRRRVRVAANGGGVEVGRAAAEGIGKLTALHTLGVVNIAGGKGGLALLKELENLTQLRKLGLSGINRENWKDLCSAISGHLPHLESLSLQLLLLEEDSSSYEFACFDDICVPRKTLKILKVLYTSSPESVACIRQTWIRLSNTFRHEWRVSSGDDIGMLFSQEICQSSVCCPQLKPVEELLSFGHLPVPDRSKWTPLEHLSFDCHGDRSNIIFGGATFFSVETLNIFLCNGSACIDGLRYLHGLKRVCVTGWLSSDFEQYLRKQLDQHANKPELKLITRLSDQW